MGGFSQLHALRTEKASPCSEQQPGHLHRDLHRHCKGKASLTFFLDATASRKGKKSPQVNLGPDTIQLQVLQQQGSGGRMVLPFPCGVLRRFGNILSKLCFSPGTFEVIP